MLARYREALESFAIERIFAANMFAGDQLAALADKGGGIDAKHHVPVAFEQAASAVAGEARPAAHAHEAADRGHGAADIEHCVQHSRHRLRGAGAHRDEKRSASVGKALAGRLLKKRKPFGEPIRQILRCAIIAAQGRGTQADREHEGGRHRQTEGGDARKVRRLAADELGGIRSGRSASDARDLHAACFLGHQVGEHVLAQQMTKCRQTIG